MIRFDDYMYTTLKWNVVRAFQQLGFIRIPVDPIELMASAGIQVLPYSTALTMCDLNDLVMLSTCPSGISFTLQDFSGEKKRFVGYNNYESTGRGRFTNAHESAHCFLGHREDSETAERQANFWARYAIAPPVIIHQLGLQSGEEVAEQFGLSNECASYAFNAYEKWLPHRANDKDIDESIVELYTKGLLLEQRESEHANELEQLEAQPMSE